MLNAWYLKHNDVKHLLRFGSLVTCTHTSSVMCCHMPGNPIPPYPPPPIPPRRNSMPGSFASSAMLAATASL